MKTDAFDFFLPNDLIAQFPLENRADSRLLYVDGTGNTFKDDAFRDLPGRMRQGDVIVLNNTRVIKARLSGVKQSGGKVEVLVERLVDASHAQALIRASHAPAIGSAIFLANDITAIVEARQQDIYMLRFIHPLPLVDLLDRYGRVPLPPYIERLATDSDEDRYQTVFAQESGAVAAPTAGLHFDQAMLDTLCAMGVSIAYITLHVGAGTFQPVRAENIEDHVMHVEPYSIPPDTIEAIQGCKASGGRVLAVGTTCLRALEASARANDGQLVAGQGETDLFITPGYRFQMVDRLLTNFHLPRSTLLMLVSAFAGMDTIQRAYQHAVAARYRFFSYGDAMLLEIQS